MGWVYLNLEQAIEIHPKTVDVSGGDSAGHLEIGKLGAVLQHIQNDVYYPTFDAKLTHLFFCACKFHCFEDGNKRIAIALCAQMLLLNGYLRSVSGFFAIRKTSVTMWPPAISQRNCWANGLARFCAEPKMMKV